MRPIRLWRLLPGAALILLSAGSSLAMTLGRAQGMTLIGRPLDVTVPVVLDAGSDPTELCPGAEVFYGESRVEAPIVSLRATGGDTAVLRVQVPRPVDEAFVTVQVRVGCTQILSRRFVLLTEEPGDTARAAAQPTPVAPAVIAPPTTLPVRPIESAPAATSAAPAPVSAPLSTSSAAAPAAAAPVRRARPARVAAAERPAIPAKRPAPVTRPAAPAPAPAAVERPRLKLDAADLSPAAATGSGLKPSAALQGPALSVDAAPRPDAASASASASASAPVSSAAADADAGAPGQALNTPAEDLLRNAERMVTLEADMRAMRESMQKNQAMLAEMRGRLEQAEGERYANGLVYALAALLAAACGLAGLFWYRSRRVAAVSSSWWADRSQLPEGHSQVDAPRFEPQALAPAIAVGGAVAVPAHDRGPATLAAASLTGAADVRVAAADAAPDHIGPLANDLGAGFLPSETADLPAAAAASVNLDDLSDLQQQAEFFVSLGEYERAIAVLREHIDAQPQGSTIAWLELLDLYHRLRRESDYEQLRRDYEWVFSHQLPAFADYAGDAQGIEGHADAMARIQSLWNQPAVLELIDQSVLRMPRRDGEPAMGLQALRDLLMLHGVASELATMGAQPEPRATADAMSAMAAAPVFAAAAPVIAAPAAAGAIADSPVADSPAAAAPAADLGPGSFTMEALSLDPLPHEEWKKLAPANSRPAGLDLNLDDLDQPPAVDTAASVLGGRQHGNLLDFDLDLSEEFKLPKR